MNAREVVPNLKPDPEACICGCGAMGSRKRKNGHLVSCDGRGCMSCRGSKNSSKGRTKQRDARKRLGVPKAKQAGTLGNEENWRWVFRVEVKSGQQVQALTTRFLAAEAQSAASKAHGDPRPFMFVAMPDGMSDGIVAVRLSEWERSIVPLLVEYGGVA